MTNKQINFDQLFKSKRGFEKMFTLNNNPNYKFLPIAIGTNS